MLHRAADGKANVAKAEADESSEGLGIDDLLEEDLPSQIRALLNRLCPANSECVAEQFAGVSLDSTEEQRLAADLFIRKALDEPHCCKAVVDVAFTVQPFTHTFVDKCWHGFETYFQAAKRLVAAAADPRLLVEWARCEDMPAWTRLIGHLHLSQRHPEHVVADTLQDFLDTGPSSAVPELFVQCACELYKLTICKTISRDSGVDKFRRRFKACLEGMLQRRDRRGLCCEDVRSLVQDVLEDLRSLDRAAMEDLASRIDLATADCVANDFAELRLDTVERRDLAVEALIQKALVEPTCCKVVVDLMFALQTLRPGLVRDFDDEVKRGFESRLQAVKALKRVDREEMLAWTRLFVRHGSCWGFQKVIIGSLHDFLEAGCPALVRGAILVECACEVLELTGWRLRCKGGWDALRWARGRLEGLMQWRDERGMSLYSEPVHSRVRGVIAAIEGWMRDGTDEQRRCEQECVRSTLGEPELAPSREFPDPLAARCNGDDGKEIDLRVVSLHAALALPVVPPALPGAPAAPPAPPQTAPPALPVAPQLPPAPLAPPGVPTEPKAAPPVAPSAPSASLPAPCWWPPAVPPVRPPAPLAPFAGPPAPPVALLAPPAALPAELPAPAAPPAPPAAPTPPAAPAARDLGPLRQAALPTLEYPAHVAFVMGCVQRAAGSIGRVRVHAFGSSVNGLGDRSSDVDLTLEAPDTLLEAFLEMPLASRRQLATKVLRFLWPHLEDRGFRICDSLLHDRVKVPIVKLRYGALECDLSCNNLLPLFNTRLLKAYVDLDHRVATLVLTVKQWAKDHGVHGAPQGHLSSYAFTLMSIFYMQVRGALPCIQHLAEEQPVLFQDGDRSLNVAMDLSMPNAKPQSTVDLNDFFHFFVSEFPWGKSVVSVRRGMLLSTASYPVLQRAQARICEEEASRMLHVEDPFDTERNLNYVLRPGHSAQLWKAFEAAEARALSPRDVALG